MADESFDLACNIKAFPTPEISWYKNDEKLENGPNRIISANQIRVGEAKESDTGRYYCAVEVEDEDGKLVEEASNPVHITVRSNGFKVSPGDLTSERVGNRLEIKCVPDSGTVNWEHNRRILQPGESVDGISVDDAGSLIIAKVRKSDEGTYACIASNSAGEAEEEG